MSAERKKWLYPLAFLGLGLLGVTLLVITRPKPHSQEPQVHAPVVEVETVAPRRLRFVVEAQGTVAPRRESALVPQVSGEVVWVSQALTPGGFFEAGDPLLRIDPADYEAALESARASVARAESEARRARKELGRQRKLQSRSAVSEARIDDAENSSRVSEAALREARARLATAERDLARTEVRAPYSGRVRSESVGVGEYVNRGSPVGHLYAVDWAEVRLPVPDRELRYLDVSLTYRPQPAPAPAAAEVGVEPGPGSVVEAAEAPPVVDPESRLPAIGPEVRLRAEFAGREHEWNGRIVRTEGEIDAKSRMVTLVAGVEDPYGRRGPGDAPPLKVGLFVEAQIQGREVDDAVVLPRSALRDGNRVLVVDSEDRVHFREVQVLRLQREEVVVGTGLAVGERVCVSVLPGAIEGMLVRVAGADAAPAVARSAP